MRDGPSSSVLAAAASWECVATSWLGGVVLAENIPLTGRATGDVGQKVSKGITVRVPRFTVEDGRTVDWLPSAEDSPLAKNGQVLDVTIVAAGVPARLGRYLITDWADAGGHIEVTCAGMLRIPEDDRLPEPLAPRDGGTLRSEFTRLLPPQLSAQFDPALTNRACPAAMEWGEDRSGALYEIADAWPARLREDEWGQVVLLPPLPDVSTPVLSITDGDGGFRAVELATGDVFEEEFTEEFPGELHRHDVPDGPGGTVMAAPPSDTRTGGYNRVVARSSRDGVDAQAVAEITSGPLRVDGPYGAVTYFFTSPLLEDELQCVHAAQSILADVARRSRVLQVRMAPDPRIDLDDPVEVVTDRGMPWERRTWGYVVGYDLPLTVADGDARVDVGVF